MAAGGKRRRKASTSTLDTTAAQQENGTSDMFSVDDVTTNGDASSLAAPHHGHNDAWQSIVRDVNKSVVSIVVAQPMSFDTEKAGCSMATGFIVDAERGIVMTNRHVVQNGPFVGYLIFENHEQTDATAIYRDPVHDFGFLRFDRTKVKYMTLQALELRPELAKVGLEIRVVGNDSGEKLSIHAGFISRLDRNAPEFDTGQSDFNTNYLQAALNLSGGSSGSPVVTFDGSVVALQAAGNSDSSTDFFLPLDRPKRALHLIQQGKEVKRGSIQCQWSILPYDDCRRLGLSDEQEEEVRRIFPQETGMLVATTVLPAGPSFTFIEEGDILLKVNGKITTSLIELEMVLDDSVHGAVGIAVSRGGEVLSFTLNVQSTHDLVPDRLVEWAGGKYHTLPYHLARKLCLPIKGVYVCESPANFDFAGLQSGALLESINHQTVPDLDTFVKLVESIPDGARIPISWRVTANMHSILSAVIRVERRFHATFREVIRNDKTGVWDFHNFPSPPPHPPLTVQSVHHPSLQVDFEPAQMLNKSFVRVSFFSPSHLDGFPLSCSVTDGLVVRQGLVFVSRAVVPYDFGQITLSVADSVSIPAKVKYLHPTLNFALLEYDTLLLPESAIHCPEFRRDFVKPGTNAYFCGWLTRNRMVALQTRILELTTVNIPYNHIPRYKGVNFEAVILDTPIAHQCTSGVVVDEAGGIVAIWTKYLGNRTSSGDEECKFAIPTPYVIEVLERIELCDQPQDTLFPAELKDLSILNARSMGLSDQWADQVQAANPSHPRLFRVFTKYLFDHQALQEGDILLECEGTVVSKLYDLQAQFCKQQLAMVRDTYFFLRSNL